MQPSKVRVFFEVNDTPKVLNIGNWTGFVGQHYNRLFDVDGETVVSIKEPYVSQNNIAWFASHRHKGYPSANESYQYSYLYKYELDLLANATGVTLPNNPKIRIFAITLAQQSGDNIWLSQPLYDDFKNNKAIKLWKQ